MSDAVLKSICSKNVLQIIIKASASEFTYSIHATSIFLWARMKIILWKVS